MEKIKAILKILGVIVMVSLIGAIISVFTVLFSISLGSVAVVLGILVMLVITASGAWIGGIWAGRKVSGKDVARKVAIWSAVIFLIMNISLIIGGRILMAVSGAAGRGSVSQAFQVGAQSILIYAYSFAAMRRVLKKRGEQG
jgi:hypothetical protein